MAFLVFSFVRTWWRPSALCDDFLISLFSTIFLVPLISAQTADSPSTDDVKKFLEVMRIERQLNTMLQIMTKSAKAGARQGFLQKMPDATPEQAADVESLAT